MKNRIEQEFIQMLEVEISALIRSKFINNSKLKSTIEQIHTSDASHYATIKKIISLVSSAITPTEQNLM